MLLKRYIPISIVAFFGALTLSAWFIDNETIETFANDDATQFFDIIAAFAVFLGAFNVVSNIVMPLSILHLAVADFLWISYIYVSIDLSKNNLFINSL